MYNIVVANSATRTSVTMSGDETVREAWEKVFGEYHGESLMLNGVTVYDVDTVLSEFDIDEEKKHFLTKLAKVENA